MLDERFKKVEDEYFRLKGQLAAGRLTNDQFSAALDALMIEHEGRWWMIGANSGKWYVHDGKAWTEADPPGTDVAAVPAMTADAPFGFDVILQAHGERKMEVINVIRQMLGNKPGHLAQAKARAEAAPVIFRTGMTRDDAEEVKQKLEQAGATVVIRRSA